MEDCADYGTTYVAVDPFRITEEVNFRPLNPEVVNDIYEAIVEEGQYSSQWPITGKCLPDGNIFLVHGKHRVAAVCKAIEKRKLSDDTKIPMIDITKCSPLNVPHSCLLPLVSGFNEEGRIANPVSFADTAVMIARLRDDLERKNKKSMPFPPWKTLISFAVCETPRKYQAKVKALLSRGHMHTICLIVRGLRSPTLFKKDNEKNIDLRAWEMFLLCSHRRDAIGCKNVGFQTRIRNEQEKPFLRKQILSRAVMSARIIKSDEPLLDAPFSEKPTVFEKVLFMSLLMQLAMCSGEIRTRDRQNQVTEKEDAEVLGLFLRWVVCSWNGFASHFGFRNIEEMISPYIIFNEEKYMYTPIKLNKSSFRPARKPQRLFAPEPQSFSILHNESVAQSEAIEVRVANRSDLQDHQLRVIAEEFLNDVRKSRAYAHRFESASSLRQFVSYRTFSYCDSAAKKASIPKALREFAKQVSGSIDNFQYLSAPSCSVTRIPVTLPLKRKNESRSESETYSQELGMQTSASARCSHQVKSANCTSEIAAPKSITSDASTECPRNVKMKRDQTASREDGVVGQLHETHTKETEMEKDDFGKGVQKKAFSIVEKSSVESCAKEAPETYLRNQIGKWAVTYRLDFVDLPRAHSKSEIPIIGQTSLVLVYPPVLLHEAQQNIRVSNNVLSLEKMTKAVQIIASLLRSDGRVLLFAEKGSRETWIQAFEKFSQLSLQKYIYVIYSRRSFQCSTAKRVKNIRDIVEEVILFAAKKRSAETAVPSRGFEEYVPASYTCDTNVIDNVPSLSPGESVIDLKSKPVCGKQKSLALYKELISRYTRPNDTVVDIFGGTYTAGEACISLQEPRRFVGCEIDDNIHKLSFLRLIQAFARQILSKACVDTHGKEQLFYAREYLKSKTTKSVGLGSLQPAGRPFYTALPEHLLTFFCGYLGEVSLKRHLNNCSVGEWKSSALNELRGFDNLCLLSVDAMHHNVFVSHSTIPGAGEGVFAASNIEKGSILGWYNGTIVYRNLKEEEKDDDYIYGRKELTITRQRFCSFAMEINRD